MRLHSFWNDGGLTLEEPPGDDCRARILLQPDGDVIVSLPKSFGSDPEDLQVAERLMRRAETELNHVAREGLAGAANTAVRVIDVGLAGLLVASAVPVVTSGEIAALGWMAIPAALGSARAVAGARLRRALGSWTMRRVRRKFRL